jgi:NodT family efflux transporter outer membrane factor (OMF) lipoprotein
MSKNYIAALTAAGLALAGCAVGPNYSRPSAPAPAPALFKEAEGWKQAEPSDAVSRADWWTVFGDPVLNGLEAKVAVDNQNLIAAEASYRQARALLDQQRATLFPTVNLIGSVTRATYATDAGLGAVPASVILPTSPIDTYSAALGATWDVDVWGRIRRTIEGARATAQASAADLAGARLSAQVLLAADYFQLREADEEKRLVDATVKGYADNLRIVQGRYRSGVSARGDVLTAKTQLKTAQAGAADLLRTRAQLEHAIAVLAGQAPTDLTIAQAPWRLSAPAVPVAMPASLLERRPDIAGAERRMRAANAQIGVQTAGYFPDLSLSGQYGFDAETLQRLFNATTNSWSIGANAAQTVFDAGATSARVRQARAGYDAAVATYRQTVLTAFQQVEDNIAALRVLEAEYDLDLASSAAADEAESLATKQYKAGQVDYTTVVVAQNTALAARRTVAQSARDRMVASVDLISALGGGWSQQQLARK